MLLKVLDFTKDVAIVCQIDRCGTLVEDWVVHCCETVFEGEMCRVGDQRDQ
jgi:hypothetical protein